MKNYAFFAVFSFMLMAVSGCCHTPQVQDSGTRFAAEAVQPFVDSGECSGAISVLYQDGKQETACLGWADVDKKIPMDLNKMFMQCSQTKGFCGVSIAILVEEGKISLDDPISKYLPEFKDMKIVVRGADKKVTLVPAKTPITIRMVMNHTAGFPFEVPTKNKKGWASLSLQDSAREAAANPLRFEPGTRVQYSNTGIDIGAAIVEVVTGKGWDEFLKERVLDPLEMENTTFNPSDKQLANSVQMYKVKAGKKAEFQAFANSMPLPHNGPTVFPSAGAGLWTNAADQIKFYKMLMNLGIGDNGVRILKEETVLELIAKNSRPKKLGGYSLGLAVNSRGDIAHGGAYGTSARVNWKKKQMALWVTQQTGGPRPWSAAWNKAVAKFFAETSTKSIADEYTGRTK